MLQIGNDMAFGGLFQKTHVRSGDKSGASRPRHLRPKKHTGPDVCIMFDDLRYRRTHSVFDRHGREIFWCWTTVRNKESLFVGFREVHHKKSGLGFRDSYRARKARWRVKDWALKQFNASPDRKQTWTYHTKR